MIEHVGIYVSDYQKAKEFYSETLKPLGYKLNMDFPDYETAGFMEGGHTSFWIGHRQHPQGMHVAFGVKNKSQVGAFYNAALVAGGIDNGAPGYRPQYGPGYYAAFVHDADRNNIEAVYFETES